MGGAIAGHSNIPRSAGRSWRCDYYSCPAGELLHHLNADFRQTLPERYSESREILKDAGIDFMTANENLVMASNMKGIHTISQAKEVRARLRAAAVENGGVIDKATITRALQEMKDELEQGGILRILHPKEQ